MAAIDLTKAPTEPPPIGAVCARLYADGPRAFDDPALEKLQAELDLLSGDLDGMFWALITLASIAKMIRDAADPVAADRLEALIKAQRDRYPAIETAVRALPQQQAEAALAKSRKAFGKEEGSAKAPVHDAKAPTGTKRLSDLLPPSALQPPVPRKNKK